MLNLLVNFCVRRSETKVVLLFGLQPSYLSLLDMVPDDPQDELTSEFAVRQWIGSAVKSIHWSYGIFWSLSPSQPGVLKWGNGFYNGEMKSKSRSKSEAQQQQQQRDDDEDTYSQRSEQLRELFKSLAASESNNTSPPAPAKKPPKAPAVMISLEDLTQSEWFYLLCMSFIFNPGQELPGKAFAKGQTLWLCNAHLADNKVFGRSLLAKSASIKTVACFPVPGGVVELGVTEKVSEDAGLIKRITDCLMDESTVSKRRSDVTTQRPSNSTDRVTSALNNLDTQLVVSHHTSTTDPFGLAELDDSFIVDSISEEAVLLQNWQFMDDDDLNQYVHDPGNSASKIAVHPEKMALVSAKVDRQCPLKPQECNQMKDTTTGDLLGDEMHYQSVISAILQTSVVGPHYGDTNKASSFMSFRKEEFAGITKSATPQRILKKVLTQVPKMHSEGLLGSPEKDHQNVIQKGCDDTYLPEAEDLIDMDLPAEETGLNHVLAERRRREKLKRRFLVLRSLVPTTAKVDKISILDDTIKYLKELESKVEELESAKETAANTVTTMVTKSAQDGTKETSSYNYEVEETHIASKKRRKAFDGGGNNVNRRASSHRKDNDDLVVEVEDKDVRIEVRCGWRKGLVPEVMEALSNLDLESTSVYTLSSDGILYLKITSKVQGLKVASAKLIKQEMQRIVHNR